MKVAECKKVHIDWLVDHTPAAVLPFQEQEQDTALDLRNTCLDLMLDKHHYILVGNSLGKHQRIQHYWVAAEPWYIVDFGILGKYPDKAVLAGMAHFGGLNTGLQIEDVHSMGPDFPGKHENWEPTLELA
jgi:hypothetical protein